MTQEPEKSNVEPITALLGRRVLALRKAAGLSQTQLGERVAVHGPDWSRTTVAKLESGGRKAVTVQELLALAIVFDLPPVMLLADPRHVDVVPVSTGIEVDPWSALLWFTGRHALTGHPGSTWRDASELLRDGYAAAELLVELGETTRSTNLGQELGDAMTRALLNSLAASLARISAAAAPLPSLPADVVKRACDLGVDLPGAEG